MIEYILFGIFCIVALGFILYYIFVYNFFPPYPTLYQEIINHHSTDVDDALDEWLRTRGARKTMVYLKRSKQWSIDNYKKIKKQSTILGRLRVRRYIKIKARGEVNAFTFSLIRYERQFIRDGNTVKEEIIKTEIDQQTYSKNEIIKRIKEIHYSKGDGLFKFVNHPHHHQNKKHQRKHTHRNKRRQR